MSWLSFGKNKARKELSKLLRGQEVQGFPVVASKILELLREPEVDFSKVAEQLKFDPALTVQVLRTVNSAAYGASHPIQDVQHAVSFLGLAALEQVVLGMAVLGVLPSTSKPGFDLSSFWRTGAYRAAMAKNLSVDLHPSKGGECFTAALLQDLAVPILVHAIPAVYGPVLLRWGQGKGSSLEALEKNVMGMSHDEVGSLLCSYWELPDNLTKAIALHHSPEVTDQELPAALRLVATLWENQSDEGIEQFLELGKGEYGLDRDHLLDMLELSRQQAHELATSLLM